MPAERYCIYDEIEDRCHAEDVLDGVLVRRNPIQVRAEDNGYVPDREDRR